MSKQIQNAQKIVLDEMKGELVFQLCTPFPSSQEVTSGKEKKKKKHKKTPNCPNLFLMLQKKLHTRWQC